MAAEAPELVPTFRLQLKAGVAMGPGKALPMFRVLLLCALLALTLGARAQDGPAVAAASSLKFALDEIVAIYRRATGASFRVSYGSSGNFTQQIEQGAPFELFLSADEAHVARLHGKGLTQDAGVVYAVGRIVLFAPDGSPLQLDARLKGVRAALHDGTLKRFAIANPEHAPYGVAARDALRATGLWSAIEPKLVYGENATQTAQFAASGSAQGGILPLSLVRSTPFGSAGRYVALPASLHAPLRQRMVLTRRAGAAAKSLYGYLQGPEARAILRRHGFETPGE